MGSVLLSFGTMKENYDVNRWMRQHIKVHPVLALVSLVSCFLMGLYTMSMIGTTGDQFLKADVVVAHADAGSNQGKFASPFDQFKRAKTPFSAGAAVVDAKKMFVSMQQITLFPLTDEGKFIVPNHIKRVWIDVGAHAASFTYYPIAVWNDRGTIQQEYEASNDILVIAIEPSKQYWDILSRHKNTIAIPCAIAPKDGFETFYKYEGNDCNSILPPNPVKDPLIPAQCNNHIGQETICALSLETIISMLPENLPIELLKVDGQGADLRIVKSVGKYLNRITDKVIIEAQAPRDKSGSNLLSVEADLYADALIWFDQNGFKKNEQFSSFNLEAVLEYNLVFDRIQ